MPPKKTKDVNQSSGVVQIKLCEQVGLVPSPEGVGAKTNLRRVTTKRADI
jgi:hypothetical protein